VYITVVYLAPVRLDGEERPATVYASDPERSDR
jgi:hypothetical protein